MKTFIQSALAAVLCLAACSSLQAQVSQGISPGAIVVLDVAKVFKSNQAFNDQIASIQSQAEKLKADVESRQMALRNEAQGVMENLKANSVERKDREAKLEQDMTALRTYARQGEAELMSQEATIYYQTYLQMQTIVAEAAKEYNIALVLRYDSSEIDPNNRNSVVGGVNRAVVFQKDSDLTDHVIKQMSARTASLPNTSTNK